METDNFPLTVSHSHSHTYSSNGFYWRPIHSDFPTIESGDDSTISRQFSDGDLAQLNFDWGESLDNLCKVLPDSFGVGDQRVGAGPKKTCVGCEVTDDAIQVLSVYSGDPCVSNAQCTIFDICYYC